MRRNFVVFVVDLVTCRHDSSVMPGPVEPSEPSQPDLEPRGRPLTWQRKLVLGLIPAIILFGGTELVLRLLGVPEAKYLTEKFEFPPKDNFGQNYVSDDVVFWRLRPTHNGLWGRYKVSYTHEWDGLDEKEKARRHQSFPNQDYYGAVRWQVNGKGTRGPEWMPGRKVVLFLGSSVTFGWGVRAEDSYAGLIRARLQKDGPEGVDVINAGVPNYTSYQALATLRRLIQECDPAVIVFEAGINDGSPSSGASDAEFALADRGGIPPDVIRSSNLLLGLFLLVRGNTMLEAPAATPGRRFYTSSVSKPERCRVSREEFYGNLAAVEKLGAEHGAAVYFLFPPLYHEYGKKKLRKSVRMTHAREIDMFACILAAAGVEVESSDPHERVKPRDGAFADFFIPYDEAHLSRRGHEVVADTIWQRLTKDGALR